MLARRFCAIAVALVMLTAGAGCGKKLIKTKGKVTLDGQPVSGATVTLKPVASDGMSASGFTDNDGNFTLQTYKPGDGAVPGDYKITVTKVEAPTGGEEFNQDMDPSKMTDIYKKMAGAGPKGQAKKGPKSLLPAVYGDDAKTPLKCTIPFDGDLDLPLQSNVK
jgi:hypothetical protein